MGLTVDDIVTRLRNLVGRCTHGNERFYNGPEGIETYFKESCGVCVSWSDAANEIERLKGLVADLLPFMEEDVRLALEVVPPVYEGHEKDDCVDCQWYERAIVWKQRITAGELSI